LEFDRNFSESASSEEKSLLVVGVVGVDGWRLVEGAESGVNEEGGGEETIGSGGGDEGRGGTTFDRSFRIRFFDCPSHDILVLPAGRVKLTGANASAEARRSANKIIKLENDLIRSS